MDGQPWDDLAAAFHRFIAKRMSDQSENDIVSVIQFTGDCRTIYERQQLTLNTTLGKYRGGGTDFIPPLYEASRILSNAHSQEMPVLIFMSDGEAGDCIAAMKNLVSCCPKLAVHTVGFGRGAGHGLLQVCIFTICFPRTERFFRAWPMKLVGNITVQLMESSCLTYFTTSLLVQRMLSWVSLAKSATSWLQPLFLVIYNFILSVSY